ncbi:M20 metallopeptidase family protein [Alienimonas chondri]|uniref:N-acetyldiaminopimelate deacetylase n=1 Tax=Alienimonas chondri TaxID=2681879 RepID=A0ABX1VEP6_9PLAN|nr:amidohydrolase [Alienimonas chondri]NNJ25896.1 N-acetyldiaminopimelate deacetylase [Alienimonas chondri]
MFIARQSRLLIASFALAATLSACVPALPAADPDPAAWADERLPKLLDLYRDLHLRPELSGKETETAARVAKEWRAAGYEVTEGVGGTGVVGLLNNGDGPTVMLRCDLDALPVTEATGLPFASKVTAERPGGGTTGVMHACGHDVHMTSVTGAGQYFAEHQDEWAGTVMLIAQPAEETGEGAKAMLSDDLFTRFPKPDYAVALHVTPTAAAGTVETLAGYSLANVDSVDITFHGRGGHGAQPHTTIDPIVMAAEFVLSAQAIVAREVKPTDPAVVTVGSIHAGSKHNIISDEAKLQLTVRSYSDAVRTQLIAAIERRAKGVAAAAGAEPPTVESSEGTPSLYNDPDLTARLTETFQEELGEENVRDGEQSMGGEDFSRYGKAGVPILMFRLGSVAPRDLMRYEQAGVSPPSLHSATYAPDAEAALPIGVRTLVAAGLELLKTPGE